MSKRIGKNYGIKEKEMYKTYACGIRRVRLGRMRQHLFIYNGKLYFKSMKRTPIAIWEPNIDYIMVYRIFDAKTGYEVTRNLCLGDDALVLPLYETKMYYAGRNENGEMRCLKEPKSVSRNLYFSV